MASLVGELVLTLSCPDRPGIVHAVSGFLAARNCNILDSQQYGSPVTSTFFLRVHFDSPVTEHELRENFAELASTFSMTWELHASAHRPNVLVMVSREGHCLNDLLYRQQVGSLPVDIVAVGSNHLKFQKLVSSHDIPFHHVPTRPSKEASEAQLVELIDQTGAELVVLARYMQVLSPQLCEHLAGRAINIHHSFLPSFRGARPYHQAHDRGVKLIGATAHYVTADLDEGPIIEQDVERVDHSHSPADMVVAGRDVEAQVLARAVTWHAEHRVFPNGASTVVLR